MWQTWHSTSGFFVFHQKPNLLMAASTRTSRVATATTTSTSSTNATTPAATTQAMLRIAYPRSLLHVLPSICQEVRKDPLRAPVSTASGNLVVVEKAWTRLTIAVLKGLFQTNHGPLLRPYCGGCPRLGYDVGPILRNWRPHVHNAHSL